MPTPAVRRPADDERSPYHRLGRHEELTTIEAVAIARVMACDSPQSAYVMDEYTRRTLIIAGYLAHRGEPEDAEHDLDDPRVALTADVLYSLDLFDPDELPPTDRSRRPGHPR
ncbi:hypothetical protein [Streptomyces sp. SID3343]|uniref:hypothetical protein n=1 Tax=Streptomyces sp. SID3343 TaxID=2690260 RepID=UPI00136E5279|nr:hypothetical protein [Streptomyces sp. SID3343]MYW05520.1 hypothetical protein [Streptomyces sp. SID3343]